MNLNQQIDYTPLYIISAVFFSLHTSVSDRYS